MNRVMRKPVFGVFDLVRHKAGCTATEDGQRLEIPDLDRRGIALLLAKTKALISTADLRPHFRICKKQFSHDAAQFFFLLNYISC